jgi:hypothetical protein
VQPIAAAVAHDHALAVVVRDAAHAAHDPVLNAASVPKPGGGACARACAMD